MSRKKRATAGKTVKPGNGDTGKVAVIPKRERIFMDLNKLAGKHGFKSFVFVGGELLTPDGSGKDRFEWHYMGGASPGCPEPGPQIANTGANLMRQLIARAVKEWGHIDATTEGLGDVHRRIILPGDPEYPRL